MLYGTQLSLPGALFEEPDPDEKFDTSYVADFMNFVENSHDIPHMPPRPGEKDRPLDLESATHVFCKRGPKKRGLQSAWRGPYPLLALGRKHAILAKGNRKIQVTNLRLKPARFLPLSF